MPMADLRLPALAAPALAAALLAAVTVAAHATARRLADDTAPLVSLAAPVASRTWGLPFWAAHCTARTQLCRSALAYCLDRTEAAFPGCTAVRLASWWCPAASDPRSVSALPPSNRPAPSTPQPLLAQESRP
jgi:hypothetical protein